MRRFVSILTVLLVLGCFTLTPQAQTPFVAVYFNQGLSQESMVYPFDCPPFGTLDTLYVAALNFNDLLSGIEYSIDYGNNLVWLTDFDTPPVTIGASPTGISMGFPIPQNGFFPVLTQKVLVQWICQFCSFPNDEIVVSGHPLFAPNPRATRFFTSEFVDAVGLTALTCPTIPVEETTWGRLKATFRD